MNAVHHKELVTFTIIVRRRPDGPVLPNLEYWQNTPIHKRRFPSMEEYATMYGSSAEDMETITTTLQKHGMAIINQHAGARTVTVQASAGQIASSFGVHLNYYHAPTPVAMLRRRVASHENSPDPLTETHWIRWGSLCTACTFRHHFAHCGARHSIHSRTCRLHW